MRIKSITSTTPTESRCIEVDAVDRLFAAGGLDGLNFVSHNSVVQRNIVNACIMRPEEWWFLGIDLKKVELSTFRAYSNVVLGIATTLEDALIIMRLAQQTMMKRYAEMEKMGYNNFQDLPGKNRSLMVMIDEAAELISPAGGKTDEAKEQDALKEEASMIIGSIARLGRAAGVHLTVATQRPDAKLIPGETKANLSVRINCGHTGSTASSMILDNAEGTRVKPVPRGRVYVQLNSNGDHAQGLFASPSWIDEWLDSRGLNLDGTPKGGVASVDASDASDDDTDDMEDTGLELVSDEDFPDDDDSLGDEDSADEDIFEDVESDGDTEDTGDEHVGMQEGRPVLDLKGDSGDVNDKYHRPEDDWDDELDAIIAMNK